MPLPRESASENSGGVQRRQENSAARVRGRCIRGVLPDCTLPPQRGLRLAGVLEYAFPMRYVLGFDGGGTKTDCVLMDESGAILARSRSGSSNPTSFGVEASLASLSGAATDALRAAGRSEKEVAYVVAGVSGAGETSMRWALQSGMQPRFPNARILIT